MGLFVRDPALHHVRLPQELEEGRVVYQAILPSPGSVVQGLQFLLETLNSLFNAIFVVISLEENEENTLGIILLYSLYIQKHKNSVK